VNNWNVLELLHYLDDYFTLGPPNFNICSSRLKAIEIGIPLSPDKRVGPTTCLIFLGIELDLVRIIARLPTDKHTELIQLLEDWAPKSSCPEDIRHREYRCIVKIYFKTLASST
jgi:hypothetical protein